MNKASTQAPKNSLVVPALVIAVLVIVAALAYKGLSNSPAPAPPPASVVAATRPASAPGVTSQSQAAMPPPAEAPDASPPDPKDLVANLASVNGKEPISAEQAQKWRGSLQELIREGATSVPAIEQFLAQNLDANYAGVSGAQALGYSSLRAALLDALAQIGGPDATEAMLQILQSSTFPSDVAALARTLDAQAPGQYQQAILDAARQQLNLAATDQLGGVNVLPLFQVLVDESSHGANISADLAQYAEKWPYYSAIALAALPDGAGVPSLVQMAQGTATGTQMAGAEELAQLAPQNSQALTALIELAKSGGLSDIVLAQIVPYLGGRQNQLGPLENGAVSGSLTFHIANGNQDYSAFDASGTLTQPQITQRIAIIDQLLQAVPPTDASAVEALQQQRTALAERQKTAGP